MKKLFFVFAIATAFVACNSGETKEATADTTDVVNTAAVAPAVDTTAKVDTAAAAVDTTKKP
jgi:uncharacterized protein YcfL